MAHGYRGVFACFARPSGKKTRNNYLFFLKRCKKKSPVSSLGVHEAQRQLFSAGQDGLMLRWDIDNPPTSPARLSPLLEPVVDVAKGKRGSEKKFQRMTAHILFNFSFCERPAFFCFLIFSQAFCFFGIKFVGIF